ncbi:uncharacterized protein MYCFIDRAFT_81927 [Pseudocercospora fijiensis CIRAD86]|uniref:F-box domain-containing protein n=1 Tax=Pseudocercospora fijiensis (strain CIRAD86) TaxID=383855 RepID=M3B9N1_PSEFD|nr:uncharacterized protein MYCFIDRAFT_81927 [Pseudocercospora fijiensis CIRAD86]EME85968.1 hypothetical protein MYCFIDRAFT_81927 [Pseudocercospora fijiensis CIRAD86]
MATGLLHMQTARMQGSTSAAWLVLSLLLNTFAPATNSIITVQGKTRPRTAHSYDGAQQRKHQEKRTALLDLPADLLLEIFDQLELREVDRLRLNCPKDRLSCIEFTLGFNYKHDEIEIAPNRDQSLVDAQNQQLTVIKQGGQDIVESIDYQKLRACLGHLKHTSCEILMEFGNWSHMWSDAEQPKALEIAHELLYIIVCSNLPLVKLNIRNLPYDEQTLNTISRGCFNLQDAFKNLRCIDYSLDPWTIDWDQDDIEKTLRDTAGVLKAFESATNLEMMRLVSFNHNDIDIAPITAKFLRANSSPSLRSLFLEQVECKTADLIAAIRKCAAIVRQLGLVRVDLDRSATRLQLLQTIQDCPVLCHLVIFREPVLPPNQGTYQTFLLEHYKGNGSLGAAATCRGYIYWETNEEVRKIVDFNIANAQKLSDPH